MMRKPIRHILITEYSRKKALSMFIVSSILIYVHVLVVEWYVVHVIYLRLCLFTVMITPLINDLQLTDT